MVWRRLLEVGTKFPSSLGLALADLGAATPILSDYDTRDAAAAFIQAIHPLLLPDARAQMERAILAVAHQDPSPRISDPEAVRRMLLGRLSPVNLTTDEARAIWQREIEGDELTPEVPRFESRVWWGTSSESDYLAEQGVPVDDPANVRLRELEQPVEEFRSTHMNELPSEESVLTILPALRALESALEAETAASAHVLQRSRALGVLVEAAARVPLVTGFDCDTELGQFIALVLLRASTHPAPEPREGEIESFDEFQSWGGHQPRLNAASGLMTLAGSASCATQDVFERIEQLARDPVPAVRYQIATSLNALAETNSALMWGLAYSFANEEPSKGVLKAFLGRPTTVLIRLDLERAFELILTIRDRITAGPGSDKVQTACASILASLFVWKGHAASREAIEEVASNPRCFSSESAAIAVNQRDAILWGDVGADDSENRLIRKRALELLEALVRSGWSEFREASSSSNTVNDATIEVLRSIAAMLDSAAFALYLGSGAFGDRGDKKAPRPAVSRRLYTEAGGLMDALIEVQLAPVTHHLVEALGAFVPHDPQGVFLRTARAISSGRASGYEFDNMAEETVVGMIERYLAEFPGLLATDIECREALIDVLDIFVTSGSQRAVRLTYELEMIFR